MVRECKVLINNELVTVIDFGGIEVQIPSIKSNKKFVKVLYDDGKYTVVPDDYVDIDKRHDKRRKKKQQ